MFTTVPCLWVTPWSKRLSTTSVPGLERLVPSIQMALPSSLAVKKVTLVAEGLGLKMKPVHRAPTLFPKTVAGPPGTKPFPEMLGKLISAVLVGD